MEHIIQFGVTIDDDAIQKKVMQNASIEITKELKNELFYFRYGDPSGLKPEVVDIIKGVIEQNKDEIIRLAAHEVAETMKAIEETVND